MHTSHHSRNPAAVAYQDTNLLLIVDEYLKGGESRHTPGCGRVAEFIDQPSLLPDPSVYLYQMQSSPVQSSPTDLT